MELLVNVMLYSPDSFVEELAFIFIVFFFCVLFLQSGIDKVVYSKSNLDFLKTHFQNTFFKHSINILFLVLTFFELITGLSLLLSLMGILLFGFSNTVIIFLITGILMSNLTICCLFLGQRIAGDYAGAASLTNYFLVSLLALLLLL